MLIKKDNLNKIIFILFVAIVISLLLRTDVYPRGTDSTYYAYMFDRISDYKSLHTIYYMNDYGFSHFSYIIKNITDSSYIYLFFTFFLSTLILFASYYFFLKEEHSSLLYLAIVFLLFSSSYYLLNLNGIRQGFSISMVMLAFACTFHRKNVLAILLFLVAFSLHKSAIYALAVWLLMINQWGFKNPVYFYYFLSIFGLTFNSEIITNVLNILNMDSISQKLIGLSTSTSGGVTSVEIKLSVLFILVNYFAWIRGYTANKIFLFVTNVYILYAGLVMLFCSIISFTNRSLLFFGVIEPLIFALSFYCFKDKQKFLPLILIVGVCYFMLVLLHPSFRSELLLNESYHLS